MKKSDRRKKSVHVKNLDIQVSTIFTMMDKREPKITGRSKNMMMGSVKSMQIQAKTLNKDEAKRVTMYTRIGQNRTRIERKKLSLPFRNIYMRW